MESRTISIGLISILVVAALVYVASFTYTVGHSIDDGIHIVAAKALATGQGLKLISDPDLPLNTQFPPGLSLLLVPVLLLFPDVPDNIIPMKLVMVLLTLSYVTISFFWVRRYLATGLALCLTFLVAINPETVRFSGTVIAEMGYAAISILALFFYERYDEASPSPMPWRPLVLTIVVITAAYLFRSVGLAAVLAVLTMEAYRRRWKGVVIVGIGFFLLASPWLFKSALIGTPEYRNHFWLADLEDPEQGVIDTIGLLGRAWDNFIVYTSHTIPNHLLPTLGSQRVIQTAQDYGLFPGLVVLRICLSIVVGIGFLRQIRRGIHVVDLYTIIYFGTLFLWHNRLHWKYMAPITPVLLLYLFIGLQWLYQSIPPIRTWSRVAMPVTMVVLGLACSFRMIDNIRHGWLLQGKNDPYATAYGWLKQTTPPSSLLMGIDHLGLFLYTDRQAIAPVMSNDHDYAMRYTESRGADYFIVSKSRVSNEGQGLDERYLRPVIKRYPDRFLLMYTDPVSQIQIYHIQDSKTIK